MKSKIPTSLTHAWVPHLIDRCIPVDRQLKKLGERLGQRRVATPLVSPEFNSSPFPHLKLYAASFILN